MLDDVKKKAEVAARKAAFGFIGGLLLVVGLSFLTVASWIWLTLIADTMTAALVIGCTYTGFGCLVLLIARLQSGQTKQAPPPEPEHDPNPFLTVSAAFMQGLGAGSAARGGWRRH